MDAKELTKTLIGYNTVSPLSNVEVMDFFSPRDAGNPLIVRSNGLSTKTQQVY